MFRRLSKKHYAAIAFVGVLAITGVSVAYFTGGSGSGTGSGSVGSSTPWGVSVSTTPTWSGSLTALYPGAANDTELITFTVTNNGNGSQRLANLTPAIPSTNSDAQTAAGAEIVGCTANSFTATLDAGNPAVPATLAPGATYTGKIDLTMQDTGANQDPCQGKAPAVTITATS
jgi:hypothetical protein